MLRQRRHCDKVVGDDKQIGLGPWILFELGALIEVQTVFERQRVKAKDLRQKIDVGLLLPRDVEP